MAQPLDPVQPTVSLPPIRLPLNLRQLIEKGAKDRGIGVAEAVRTALWKEFGPSQPSTANVE
jgi:hypothetical protein